MSNSYNYRLPVKQEQRLPPVPVWRQAAPVVVRGAALVAAGVIGEWLIRSAARRAIALPARRSKAVQTRAPTVIEALEETVVIRRRVLWKK